MKVTITVKLTPDTREEAINLASHHRHFVDQIEQLKECSAFGPEEHVSILFLLDTTKRWGK